MVEFKIKVHPEQHLAYIPKELFKMLGPHLTAIADQAAVVFFPENMKAEDVLRSLEIIMADLKHGLTMEKEREIAANE